VAEERQDFWDFWRNTIRTKKGGWEFGKGVTAGGYSLFDELLGNYSFAQIWMLSIIGTLPERRLADWLEGVFVCMSWPDPRLWPNYIGALAGTSGGAAVAGITAGIIASDSKVYGPGTAYEAVDFIVAAACRRAAGSSVEELVAEQLHGPDQRLVMPGYVRPLMKGDDRVPFMLRLAESLGFDQGPHVSLALEFDRYLFEHFEEGINVSGYVAAFLTDQGFDRDTIARLCALVGMAGIAACYSETADRTRYAFLPLRCDDIDYQGVPERPVPDPD
jgi:citrate synthase